MVSLQTIVHKKKTTTYGVENPGPGLGQAQQFVWIKLVNEIPTLLP